MQEKWHINDFVGKKDAAQEWQKHNEKSFIWFYLFCVLPASGSGSEEEDEGEEEEESSSQSEGGEGEEDDEEEDDSVSGSARSEQSAGKTKICHTNG